MSPIGAATPARQMVKVLGTLGVRAHPVEGTLHLERQDGQLQGGAQMDSRPVRVGLAARRHRRTDAEGRLDEGELRLNGRGAEEAAEDGARQVAD